MIYAHGKIKNVYDPENVIIILDFAWFYEIRTDGGSKNIYN